MASIEDQSIREIEDHLRGGGHYVAAVDGILTYAVGVLIAPLGETWLYLTVAGDDRAPQPPFPPAREVGALLMRMRAAAPLSEWEPEFPPSVS